VNAADLRGGHQIDLLQEGMAFFPALIEAIEGSRREIRLETYIFHFDESGERVAQALEQAALRGVAVYLVMDAVGTPAVPPIWAQRFDQAGVQWRLFLPLGSFGLLIPGRWRRMHRKLCVIDEAIGFCGGINVLNDYFDLGHGLQHSPRFDFSVRVQGPLVADMRATMLSFWQRLQLRRDLKRLKFEGAKSVWRQLARGRQQVEHSYGVSQPGVSAALVLRDNVRHRSDIERAYRQAIARAREEVFIANAYFLPGGKLRRALIHAARRGVRVRVLLQGRYEYFMQYHAAKPVYRALLEAGVEIHEYQAGFLHAKVAVVDGKWATVGSSNLDPLSLLLAREANVVVSGAEFATNLQGRLERALTERSVPVDLAGLRARSFAQRCKDQLAYGLMRLTLFVTGRRY